MPEAGRVIAGNARGVRLAAPGPGTRPLGDRMKQAVFGSLEPDLPGASVLDLCAGSGGAAIEALSRGSARAVLVERDAATCRIIGQNLRRAGVADRALVVRRDAAAWTREEAASAGPFRIVILDPPYGETALRDACLLALGAGGALAPDARVIVTSFAKTAPPPQVGLLRSVRERRFGETVIVEYRLVGEEA